MEPWQGCYGSGLEQAGNALQTGALCEESGKVRIGLVVDSTVFDIGAANGYLVQKAHFPTIKLPTEMRELIEQGEDVSPRLYQIANFLKNRPSGLPFAYDVTKVSIKAPIKYPWNLLNLAANYKAHAEGMGQDRRDPQSPPASGGFNAAAASQIDPDRDGPIVFAKSPCSCIIDPGEAYLIPPGRTKIDWEGELAIVMGKPAHQV